MDSKIQFQSKIGDVMQATWWSTSKGRLNQHLFTAPGITVELHNHTNGYWYQAGQEVYTGSAIQQQEVITRRGAAPYTPQGEKDQSDERPYRA